MALQFRVGEVNIIKHGKFLVSALILLTPILVFGDVSYIDSFSSSSVKDAHRLYSGSTSDSIRNATPFEGSGEFYLFGSTGVAGSSFSPSDLPNLLIWLHGSESEITEDAGGISVWENLANSAANATSTAEGQRPNLITGGLNNKDVVSFKAETSTESVTLSYDFSLERTDPFTFAFVYQSTETNPSAISALFCKRITTNSATPGYSMFIRGDQTGDPLEFTLANNSGASNGIRFRFARPNDLNFHTVIITHDETAAVSGYRAFVDGDEKVLTTVYDNSTASTLSATLFRIGSDSQGTGFPLNGFIAEFIHTGSELTDAEIDSLNTYFTDEWFPTTPITANGTYAGTGSQVTVTLGWKPDFVVIKNESTTEAYFHDAVSWHDRTGKFITASSTGAGVIELTSTGFTTENGGAINGETYHYFAYKDNSSDSFLQLSYQGNATAGRTLNPYPHVDTDFSFSLIKRDSAQPSVWSFYPSTTAATWEGVPSTVTILGRSVTLGLGNEINQWNGFFGEGTVLLSVSTPSNNPYIHVTTYTGTGASGRNLSLPWYPELFFIVPLQVPSGGTSMRIWFPSLGANETLVGTTAGVQTGEVTGVSASSITVSNSGTVNESGLPYGLVAFKKSRFPNPIADVRLATTSLKSSSYVQFTDGYATCGQDASLEIDGAVSIEWFGVPQDASLTMTPLPDNSGNDAVADKHFPLIFRSSGVVNTVGNMGYGMELCASQIYQPDINNDPWLGTTLLIAPNNRWRIRHTGDGGSALDSYPFNTGLVYGPELHHFMVTTNSTGTWRVYHNGVLVKMRDRDLATDIDSTSSHLLVIGARQQSDATPRHPTTAVFRGARIYDRVLSSTEAANNYYSFYSGYPAAVADFVEEWLPENASGSTITATNSAANNCTIVNGTVVP